MSHPEQPPSSPFLPGCHQELGMTPPLLGLCMQPSTQENLHRAWQEHDLALGAVNLETGEQGALCWCVCARSSPGADVTGSRAVTAEAGGHTQDKSGHGTYSRPGRQPQGREGCSQSEDGGGGGELNCRADGRDGRHSALRLIGMTSGM